MLRGGQRGLKAMLYFTFFEFCVFTFCFVLFCFLFLSLAKLACKADV